MIKYIKYVINCHAYYIISDVFATASQTETQGLTVIEAMAASLPVVAVDDESFRNAIVENVNGYLFDTKREYIKRVSDLLDDKNKLKKFSDQARINADSFSSKYFADRVLKVYKLAIKNANTKNKDKTIVNGFKNVLKGVNIWKR